VSSFPRPYLSLAPEYPATAYPDPGYAAPGYGSAVAPEPVALPFDDTLAPGDESWRMDALCAETDPEAFFPEKGGSTREAKRVCAGCPVRLQCLETALRNDERFGIWGGLSERERRRLRLQRRMPLSA
jgi:WhiB family transcriptional regulator, redox-sensing transcriptional regulator